ncbi:glycosyltransferase family 4 protein [Phormidesmis priestleyi ULC007]|uniref:Glycosyltransferase family 4 protein n=1 Tax=Phormidesmis priestleyi ULC007 TaxID=1920490 RepID=A0A2T1DMN9_9CYAN|nr:glycosyltransferase [Phormidesmis priestleyi]PSB21731.1 glycosyltransferase family 4 protein [Phormidesmis priestleyi ULC007]PZO50854.1 MAG: glycosyltransferase family 4 protein [Phormidesmis priestleyi]
MTLNYALVHEWLTPKATGGSELVVREILKHIDADLYALIDFESVNPDSYLYQRKIGTTFLQHFPFAQSGVQKYLPFLPLAIEQLDLRHYDVILSSSHAVAKGVLTTPQQLHVCYCHAPMRYVWDLTFDYLNSSRLGRGVPGVLTRYLLHQLRQWDVLSANRVDYFIANSKNTARRIWRYYRRPAEVIYPPVEVDRFPFQAQKQDFYVTVSRLVSYKKIALIVRAFNQLGLPLIVIGSGSELSQLQQLAKSNVQILGWQPDAVVEQYMAQAKAFVYAAYEDFGIAPVEAQACGTPVIAYGAGGTLETVRDLRHHQNQGTGILFPQQTEVAIVEAVKIFEQHQKKIEPEILRTHALSFHPKVFQQRYLAFLEHAYQEFQTKNS